MDKKRINPYRKYLGIIIPIWMLRNPNISHSAMIVYGRLAMYAGSNGKCFPRQKTLADEVAMSTRNLLRCLRELEEKHKLIERDSSTRGCTYYFLEHDMGQYCQDDTDKDVCKLPTKVSHPIYKENHIRESSNVKVPRIELLVVLKTYFDLKGVFDNSYTNSSSIISRHMKAVKELVILSGGSDMACKILKMAKVYSDTKGWGDWSIESTIRHLPAIKAFKVVG